MRGFRQNTAEAENGMMWEGCCWEGNGNGGAAARDVSGCDN